MSFLNETMSASIREIFSSIVLCPSKTQWRRKFPVFRSSSEAQTEPAPKYPKLVVSMPEGPFWWINTWLTNWFWVARGHRVGRMRTRARMRACSHQQVHSRLPRCIPPWEELAAGCGCSPAAKRKPRRHRMGRPADWTLSFCRTAKLDSDINCGLSLLSPRTVKCSISAISTACAVLPPCTDHMSG